MNDNVKSTYKSNDTEEWLDRVFTCPIGFHTTSTRRTPWQSVHTETFISIDAICVN